MTSFDLGPLPTLRPLASGRLPVPRHPSSPDSLPSIRSFSLHAPVLPVDMPVHRVEAQFLADPSLRGIVARWQDDWHLLTRAQLREALAGRFGYGRALLERRVLADLLPLDTVVVSGHASLTDAAELSLERLPVVSDLLVVHDGGEVGLVPVSAVFAALAEGYREAALTDSLTGLPNRLAVQAEAVLASMSPDGAPRPALLYVDLDRFKLVNDTHGHLAGDAVLVEFAERLVSCTRPGDLVARVGGDEFVVLVAGADETRACAVAERVVLTAAAPFVVDGHAVTIGASVGVALPEDGRAEHKLSSAEVLLRHADAAMYRAKSGGRGQWARLDEAGRDVGPPLARRLRAALERGRLEVHYQPKTGLRDDRVREVEALCRWSEPDLGTISPAVFIPLAEQIGLIVPLGRWVLEQACRQAKAWSDAGEDVGVAVNVSAVQLARDDFVDEVVDVLGRIGLAPGRLRLEVTESAAITEPAATVVRLRRLASLGVLLSLDDFGTGYSSLSLLRSLPVHELKIDKSFIDDIDSNPDDVAMVAMLVQLAHRLGLTVIAEGVERPEQLALLRSLGCDAVQGFLLGRPVRADHLALPGPGPLGRTAPGGTD